MLACRLERLRQRQGLVDVEVEVKGMERARELAGGRENGREPGVSGPDSFSLQALCLHTALRIRKTGSISRAWLELTAVCKLVPAAQKQSAPFPTNYVGDGHVLQCTSCRHLTVISQTVKNLFFCIYITLSSSRLLVHFFLSFHLFNPTSWHAFSLPPPPLSFSSFLSLYQIRPCACVFSSVFCLDGVVPLLAAHLPLI